MFKTYGENVASSNSSSCSAYSCSHVGEFEKYKACQMEWCMPGTRRYCKELSLVATAPLSILPHYLVSWYPGVREAAKARFIELEEAKW